MTGPTSGSRRRFLATCGGGAAAWAATALLPGQSILSLLAAEPLPADRLSELAGFALDRAKKAGAGYADIRLNRYRSQVISMRSQPDMASGTLNHVPSIADTETFGFGVRVLAGGAWGFAASNRVTREEIERAVSDAVALARVNATLRREPVRLAPVGAYTDAYRTPIQKDPFDVPVDEKLELLRAANAEVKKVAG